MVLEEELLDGGHIVVSVELKDEPSTRISTHALVDCGASGYAFIDKEFARDHNLPLFKLKTLCCLEVIDGKPIESGTITYMTKVRMAVKGYEEHIPMFITKLGHYSIVLGLSWLRRHDVHIGFARNTLTFDSKFCLTHCCGNSNAIMVTGISIPIPEKLNIAIVAGSTFLWLVKEKEHVALTIYAIDQVLRTYEDGDKARRAAIYVVISELRTDILAAIAATAAALSAPLPSEDDKIKGLVPAEYHEFLPLFKKDIADTLPPHRPYDHKISLKEGFMPPYGPPIFTVQV